MHINKTEFQTLAYSSNMIRFYGDPSLNRYRTEIPGVDRAGTMESAYIPEKFAKAALAILHNNMVIGQLVSTDYNKEVANFGSVVNIRKPIPSKPRRRENEECLVFQNLEVEELQVRLNQQIYQAFEYPDMLDQMSWQDVYRDILQPNVVRMAEKIDRILCAQSLRFYMNPAGRMGQLMGTNGRSTMLEAKKVMDVNRVPDMNRNILWNPESQTKVLDSDIMTSASMVGDGGTALKRAELLQKIGFRNWMSQGLPYGHPRNVTEVSGVTVDGAHSPHQTKIKMNGVLSAPTFRKGNWIVIQGDDVPHRIMDIVADEITIYPSLAHMAASGAKVYADERAPITISEATSAKRAYLKIDPWAANKDFFEIGQAITLGMDSEPYVILDKEEDEQRLILDRPVDMKDYPSGTVLNLFPDGDYNFGFDRYALTIVERPLKAPRASNVDYSIQSFGNFSIRIIIGFDMQCQKTMVTMDTLFGVAVLDYARGCLIMG